MLQITEAQPMAGRQVAGQRCVEQFFEAVRRNAESRTAKLDGNVPETLSGASRVLYVRTAANAFAFFQLRGMQHAPAAAEGRFHVSDGPHESAHFLRFEREYVLDASCHTIFRDGLLEKVGAEGERCNIHVPARCVVGKRGRIREEHALERGNDV